MFIGEYDHRLDAKNRLNVPRKFRQALKATEEAQGFFITRGLDDCLFLYTVSQWTEVTASLREKSFTDSVTRRFQRLFFSNAGYCELDGQGRVLIPDNLKRVANLKKSVTVVGVYSRIEVWSADRWKAVKEVDSGDYEALAEQLF
ncbi:MAG: division/cell wall cluster transcriptional repressor MraZ [Planctomycetes bacterium]|nr:division/cell wall cluster transcriptional repressor MraZ [Planctomycetota bacterium]